VANLGNRPGNELKLRASAEGATHGLHERVFSAEVFLAHDPLGRLPQADLSRAPLALNTIVYRAERRDASDTDGSPKGELRGRERFKPTTASNCRSMTQSRKAY